MPSKEEYWKNPEKHRKATRAYQIANPEWKKRTGREWMAKKRERAPEIEKATQKRYREKNPEICKKRTKAWIEDHPGYYMLKNAFQRSKEKGLPFNITLDDIVIPDVCPVLGIKIVNYRGQGRAGFKGDAPSLDKIIPHLGYVKGNVCIISNRANAIKRDATAAELRAIADYIDRETGICATDELLPISQQLLAEYQYPDPDRTG